jgi:hypothetical protein
MKVANPEAIRKGEKALAEAIASNFDRSVIQEIFKRVHNLDVGEEIQCANAAMGVHGDEVVYSMNFEVLVNLSVFLDRSGNFVSIASSGVAPESSPQKEKPIEKPTQKPHAVKKPNPEHDEPEMVLDSDAPLSEGNYESVLKEFVPIG